MKTIPIWINYDVTVSTELEVPDDFEESDKNIREEYFNSLLYKHLNRILNTHNMEITNIEVLRQ